MNWKAMGVASDNRPYGVRLDEKGRQKVYVEGEPGRWIPLMRVDTIEAAERVVSDVSGAPFGFSFDLSGNQN